MKWDRWWVLIGCVGFCWMGSNGRAVDGTNSLASSSEGPFFFSADDASARDVASAIADHFAVSVLLAGSAADAKVSGRLDIATNSVDRVNEWLDQVRIGGGSLAKSALIGATGGLGAAAGIGALQQVAGPVYDVEVRGLFELLDLDRTARVELRQQAQILSGSQTRFSSGEVQERELITREPETGKDLVSRIERRTIGLTLSLRAQAYPGGWQVKFVLEDSNLATGSERTTNFEGERRMGAEESSFFLLASFDRKADARIRKGVPMFGKLPGALGRAFRKSEADHQTRSVMILARKV